MNDNKVKSAFLKHVPRLQPHPLSIKERELSLLLIAYFFIL